MHGTLIASMFTGLFRQKRRRYRGLSGKNLANLSLLGTISRETMDLGSAITSRPVMQF